MKRLLFLALLIFMIPFMVNAERSCTVISGDTTTVGSEVECDSEHFYIISNDGTNIRMLAKYNLNTGISIYKVKIEKDANDTRTDSEYCNDIAAANSGVVKSDGFYNAPGYCFYSKTINDDPIVQSADAKSAHWDEDENYLYPQVGDNYMHSGANSSYPAEARNIDSSVVYSDTRYKDFIITTPSTTTDLEKKLSTYKTNLESMNFEITSIDLLSLKEIEDIVESESNQRFPLASWGDDVLSANTVNPTFGVFKTYLPSSYSWLYSTTYWNKTIFAKSGYGPGGNIYSNWYYIFVAEQGKICGAGFQNCAPETQLGCGIRPVITMSTDYVRAVNTSGVEIVKIDYLEKGGSARINKKASTDGTKINLDLTFFDVNDYVKYELLIKNNTQEDLYINDTYFNNTKDYISYEFDSNYIKAGEELTVTLNVVYKKEAPATSFVDGIFNISTNDPLIFSSELIKVPDTLKKMGVFGIVILGIVVLNLVIGLFIIFKDRKATVMSLVLLLSSIIILPIVVEAAIRIEIPVNSKVIIKKDKMNPCTYNGELHQGIFYENGQYVYSYKQESTGSSWRFIDIDGWGGGVKEMNSTEEVDTPLCTSINDKPIVSMSYMFSQSKAISFNLSSFYTPNVVNMEGMFANINGAKSIDVGYLDTSNVTNMASMFINSPTLESVIDLDKFNTSKVTNMSYMFQLDKKMKNVKITKWDFSKVENVSGMFDQAGYDSDNLNLEVKNMNLDKLTGVYEIFSKVGYNAKKMNLTIDNITAPNATNVSSTFTNLGYYAENAKINISNINFSNATSAYSLFYAMADEVKTGEIAIKNINISSATTGSQHFKYMGYRSKGKFKLVIDNVNMGSYAALGDTFKYIALESDDADIKINNINVNSATNLDEVFDMLGQNAKELKLEITNFKAHAATSARYCFRYVGQSGNNINIKIKDWETPALTTTNTMFDHIAQGTRGKYEITIDNLDMSNVTSTHWMFYSNGESNRESVKIKLMNLNTPSLTDVSGMFRYAGSTSPKVVIEGLDELDLSHVTNLSEFFEYGPRNDNNVTDLGTIDVYGTNISNIFYYCKSAKVVINLHTKPTSFTYAFNNAATVEGAEIIVNYTADVDNIDEIIATKSNYSNVIKGQLIQD